MEGRTGTPAPLQAYVKPYGATSEEWEYALVRAGRARKYAEVMPLHIHPKDLVYQDPVWQWEHECKGRTIPI